MPYHPHLPRPVELIIALCLLLAATASGLEDAPPPSPPEPAGPVEIFQIQGSGSASPLDGMVVTTQDNIVTALRPDGFFIQTPDSRDDADADTSNGIFVFTGAAPLVAVGDQVDVTAEVDEFFDFTELTGTPTVTVDSMGNPLPAAIIFDAATPSPNQPQSAVELERFEGMRISIPAGVICSGNLTFGSDPTAEVAISAGDRCFREPGIAFPGEIGLPVWDGNPEVFELDPDKMGLPNQELVGGSTFSAEGVLGFEFGDYEMWPTSLILDQVAAAPRPVRSRVGDELTVGSLNVFRLFDAVDDPSDLNSLGETRDDTVVTGAEYQRRLDKLAAYILDVLDAPDLLGIQEVEKLSVLQDLAAEIAALDAGVVYSAELVEGNDVGTIDVGFLVRDSVTVSDVTQMGKLETFIFDAETDLTHDRPPLLLEGSVDGFAFAVINNHLRSLGGIDDVTDGPRVRAKRFEQSQSLAQMVQDYQVANPALPLFVIGDLNAFQFTDGYVDVVGQISGTADPAENLVSGANLVFPELHVEVEQVVAEGERYSFIFDGNAQAIDHALSSRVGHFFVSGLDYGRGNADVARILLEDDSTPLRSSDHDGFALFLSPSQLIFADGFESGNTTAWSSASP